MIRFPTRADDYEPLTYDSFHTILTEYGNTRAPYKEMMEGFREAVVTYQKKRANINASFEQRPLTSELRVSRALKKAKDDMFNDFDNVFMRTVCKTFKRPLNSKESS